MRYFPLFLDLLGRRVLVVGGGVIAERKIELLLAAGPRIVVVAPEVTPRLATLGAAGELAIELREFRPEDVGGARLVVAATADREVNRRASAAAEAAGILVNAVDDAELSSAIVGAIVDRSPLVVAISTQGTAPALARLVREKIEVLLDESMGALARFLERWREAIRAQRPVVRERRRFYEWLLRGPVADHVRQGREGCAETVLASALAGTMAPVRGSVAIVGAGPGNPGLLTIAALRALQEADVILHDRLVSGDILALARREAERVPVGKGPGGQGVTQAAIHELMAQHADAGQRVVRLKAGDPFIFGRGGEEIEFLRAAGIPFEVVPGITAALGCAAFSGIPLTHREHASAMRLVTAQGADGLEGIDWRPGAGNRETLVVYMASTVLGPLSRRLLAAGHAPDTPTALVENGTRAQQRVVLGTLAEAPALAARHGVASPALLIVGPVAALADTLHWWGAAPIGEVPQAEGQEEPGSLPAPPWQSGRSGRSRGAPLAL